MIVGVNRFADGQGYPSISAPDYSALADAQKRRVAEARRTRDRARLERALAEFRAAAAGPDAPLMPRILEAVRARATVGEISDMLRDVWGVYRPS